MNINSQGLHFEVAVHAPASPPAAAGQPAPHTPSTVLLTMGWGMQLVAWPDALLQGLVQAGHQVVVYDNRDIGLSSHLDDLGKPNLGWAMAKHRFGMGMHPPYSLQDMADDALGILDGLGVARAHVLGVSMGGMISQRMAATAPQRVLSLTSIMSSSGAPGLPGPTADVSRSLMTRPASKSPADIAANTLAQLEMIGSPAFQQDRDHLYQRVLADVHRSYHPQGMLRQMLAVMADTDRYRLLADITCPTLVIHGTADPLVPIACGQDTARRIPGARFEAIEGMGHDWPPAVLPRWLALLVPHLRAADAAALVSHTP
jgi:pimeloyl-ACP methyl ester carboxylesterase